MRETKTTKLLLYMKSTKQNQQNHYRKMKATKCTKRNETKPVLYYPLYFWGKGWRLEANKSKKDKQYKWMAKRKDKKDK